jgi:sec-independent protein translocase protein TatA
MFGSLGGPELLLILLLALLIFGPRKLPEIGRTVGRSLAEFRKASSDFKMSLEHEVAVEKRQDGTGAAAAGAGAAVAREPADPEPPGLPEPPAAPGPGSSVDAPEPR